MYLSNDYFLYHDSNSLTQWQTEFSSLSYSLSQVSVSSPEQQTLLNKIKEDAQQLNESWAITALYLETTPINVTVRNIPEFQADWSIMSAQNQALIFDAQQQAQGFRTQIDQLNLTTIFLIFTLLGIFGAYFIINYLITYRRTLKSISKLQAGIGTIGSGNLDYSVNAGKKDEIADISKSVNQMAANLKAVTASKTELEQTQIALQKSEQRWSTTLSSIGDAVIATDTLGNIVFMNSQAESLTGWNLGEALHKPAKTVFNIINERTRLEVESPIERVLKEGIIVGLANHTVLVQKDGKEIPVDDSGAPIKDRDGKITGVVLVFRDVTERRQTQQEHERLSAIVESTDDAIIGKTLDGIITSWNQAAEKLYGYTANEMIGKPISVVIPTDHMSEFQQILDRLRRGERIEHRDTVRLRKDGTRLDVDVTVAPIKDKYGEIVGASTIARDITERKKAEDERNQMQTKLEESAIQLEEYASQMEELAEQRAERLKNAERLAAIGATAGMVGHDIRNPLQAIISDVYLAKTELASTADSEEKKNALESMVEIEKNIDYINKIVQDLQDYARPLNPKIEESDLNTIVNALITRNGLPKNIKVKVEISDEATKVKADSYYLNRILYNLVVNAVQAMPNGGKLTVGAHKEADDTVLLVKDTGVGIPKEIHDKIFTLMFTTKSKGQGFGLPVVKRMAEALGGTVSFESKEGKGTTFIVRLPPQSAKR